MDEESIKDLLITLDDIARGADSERYGLPLRKDHWGRHHWDSLEEHALIKAVRDWSQPQCRVAEAARVWREHMRGLAGPAGPVAKLISAVDALEEGKDG